jgi:two-component system nitrate/nitrite response regulator NarL
MIRILLADDHVLFRKGVAALLATRRNIQVVGEAKDGLEALEIARETRPDVILMDIHMPRCTGLEAIKLIKREIPSIKIVMLTVSDDNQDLFKAIKNGAHGYLLKDLEPDQLYEYMESISRGESPLSGVMATKILQEFSHPTPAQEQEADEVLDELTARETNILHLVAEGKTNKEIGSELVISENTVKIHLRNILEKLHLKNRIQIAVYASRQVSQEKGKNSIKYPLDCARLHIAQAGYMACLHIPERAIER